MRGILPLSYRTSCVYFYEAFKIYMLRPNLTSNNQTLSFNYSIFSPIQAISLPLFEKVPNITDSRFSINYNITTSLGADLLTTPYNQFLSKFNNKTNPMFSVYTRNLSLAGSYLFKVNARFQNYNPDYVVTQNFTLNLINICLQNKVIPVNFFTTLYYMIGDPPQTY